MTKIQLFKKIIKQLWYFALSYVTNYLFPIIKESFEEAKDRFIETSWNKIKGDTEEHLHVIIENVKTYFSSATYEVKEKIIIDKIFERINAPSFLKPPLKRIFKNKIRTLIHKCLEKLDTIA